MSELILHHYPQSPVAHKIRMALGLAGASWRSVEIPRVPPKPLLTPLTADYRRTPVLQIGADIYCDSQNIARALGGAGHAETLFPDGCESRAMMISSWAEHVLFDLAARLVITSVIDTAPPEFIADRGSLYFEPNWTPEGMKAALPGVILQLQSNLADVDQMLAVAPYMAGSKSSYADAAIAYLAWFIRGRWDHGPAFLEAFPNVTRLEAEFADRGEGQPTELSAEAALAIAKAATPQSATGIHTPTASDLTMAQQVKIRPRGQTADPDVIGALRYLDATRVSIDHHTDATGDVAVHLPVAGYVITAL